MHREDPFSHYNQENPTRTQPWKGGAFLDHSESVTKLAMVKKCKIQTRVCSRTSADWMENSAECLQGAGTGPSGGGLLRGVPALCSSLRLQPPSGTSASSSVNQANSAELLGRPVTGGGAAPCGRATVSLARPPRGQCQCQQSRASAWPLSPWSLLPPGSPGQGGLKRKTGPDQCLQLLRRGRSEKEGLAWPLAPGSPTYP